MRLLRSSASRIMRRDAKACRKPWGVPEAPKRGEGSPAKVLPFPLEHTLASQTKHEVPTEASLRRTSRFRSTWRPVSRAPCRNLGKTEAPVPAA